MLTYFDSVWETSTTTGTRAYTLNGAKSGYQDFSVVGNGNLCYYAARDTKSWEVGIGTWATGGFLARTTILASSNSNSAVSWGAGSRDVVLCLEASAANDFVSGQSLGQVSLSGSQTALVINPGASNNVANPCLTATGISLAEMRISTQPTLSLGSSGVLTGAYNYFVTLVSTTGGETVGYQGTSLPSISPARQKVILSGIGTGPANCVARNVYRTKANLPYPANSVYYLATISDNTTTSYTDNTPDSGLGGDNHYLGNSLATSGAILHRATITRLMHQS